jgi:hypothetical protein
MLACGLALCTTTLVRAQAQKPSNPNAPAPVQGLLVDLAKAENADDGQISVLATGAKALTNYVVTPTTTFQIVRGTQISPSSFLRDHIGQNVAVIVAPDSKPPAATTVQVLLPPPPPPHIVISGPVRTRPGHVHGVVVSVTPDKLVIHLNRSRPPAPIFGVITDVTKAKDTDSATITIQTQGKSSTIVLLPSTLFEQDQGSVRQSSSFLAEHKGENVLIYPRYSHENVAARVAVLLSGPDKSPTTNTTTRTSAKANKVTNLPPQLHLLAFTQTKATVFGLVRDGKRQPAMLAAVVPGEQVSILPAGLHSQTASTVDGMLPHTIQGKVLNKTSTVLTIRGHIYDDQGKAVDTEITVPLSPATKYEKIDGKTNASVTSRSVRPGLIVVVVPEALAPHAAEMVQIRAAATTTKARTFKGTVAAAGNGQLLVQLANGKGNESFQLTGATTYLHVVGKNQQPANLAALAAGQNVVVHAQTGGAAGSVAESVEIHLKELPKAKEPAKTKHK